MRNTALAAPVLAIEPQCRGFEHVRFNAGLLATVAKACDSAPIEFWGDPAHARMVVRELEQHSQPPISTRALGVRWSPVLWHRFRQETAFCQRVLASAARMGARLIVFTSVTAPGLIALKRSLERVGAEIPVWAVAHSVLAEAAKNPRRFWNYPLSIRRAMRLPTPDRLKLIALSEAAAGAAQALSNGATVYALDHPYLFRPLSRPRGPSDLARRPIRIGVPGAVRSRIREICGLIRQVRAGTDRVDFQVAGHVARDAAGRQDLLGLLPATPEAPVDYAAYDRRLASVDYVLMLPDETQHRFAASCTVLEAFDHGKPGLGSPSPLLDEYRSKIGEFGIFPGSADRLAEAILGMAQQFPAEQYRAQTEVILAGRSRFAPAQVALEMKRILAS